MKITFGAKPVAHENVTIRNSSNGRSMGHTRKMRALLDTGAQITVIRSDSIPRLEKALGEFPKRRGMMRTATGAQETVILDNVTVCVAGICAKGSVMATPNPPAELIVGSDFMGRAKCKIDFPKSEMVCGGKRIKIKMER